MLKTVPKALFSLSSWRVVGRYFGAGKKPGEDWIDTPAALGVFLHSRASHVSQTALYGYMKTRAGTSFPALFEDSAILESINIAKWHIWLACLSDLAVYSGVLLRRHSALPAVRIREMLGQVVAEVLAQNGTPVEAGVDFAAATRKLLERIADADLDAPDDDSVFTESPAALVYWSPIADKLKNQDVEIIRNSVRFRWQEIRRNLRRQLRAEALLLSAPTHPEHHQNGV